MTTQHDMLAARLSGEAVKEQILAIARDLGADATADVNRYAEAITADTVRIAAMPPSDMREQALAHLRGQVVVLAEKHRIGANRAAWEMAGFAITALTRGLSLAVAAL